MCSGTSLGQHMESRSTLWPPSHNNEVQCAWDKVTFDLGLRSEAPPPPPPLPTRLVHARDGGYRREGPPWRGGKAHVGEGGGGGQGERLSPVVQCLAQLSLGRAAERGGPKRRPLDRSPAAMDWSRWHTPSTPLPNRWTTNPPMHVRRIPSGKRQHVRTPRSTNQHTHLALMAHTHPSGVHT